MHKHVLGRKKTVFVMFQKDLQCCHGFSKYCLLLNATASICIIICIDPALYLCLLTALKVWVRSDEHNPRRDRVENVITTHLTSKWMKSIWPDVVLCNTCYVICGRYISLQASACWSSGGLGLVTRWKRRSCCKVPLNPPLWIPPHPCSKIPSLHLTNRSECLRALARCHLKLKSILWWKWLFKCKLFLAKFINHTLA